MAAPVQPTAPDDFGSSIVHSFRQHVLAEAVVRIRRCIEALPPADYWRKPGQHGNSVANLLVHLEGNVRQWILAGIGGRPDRRDRPIEFSLQQGDSDRDIDRIMDDLEATVREAITVIESLDDAAWLAPRRYQNRYDGNGVTGVLHVLEHFSGHAGQIYSFTKQVAAVDLQFYADL